MEIPTQRLESQHISRTDFKTPYEVVKHMGAMQAQDYHGVLWGIGLRTEDCTVKDIEQAILDRKIVRTWPMRGTLHFVAAEDIRWMLKLLTPRMIKAAAGRRRNLEIEDAELEKARKVLSSALSGSDEYLSRQALLEILNKNGIRTTGQRGYHILAHWSQQSLLCFGPHIGKQASFTLLERWVPKAKELSREESLAELTRRYFTSHGPATIKDYVWWSNLTSADAKLGLELAKDRLTQETVEDKVYYLTPSSMEASKPSAYLLPAFDEYMLGYTDRSAVLHVDHAQKVVPGGNGVFLNTLVLDGQIVGLWKKQPKAKSINLQLLPFTNLSVSDKKRIEIAAKRYEHFIDTPVVTIDKVQ